MKVGQTWNESGSRPGFLRMFAFRAFDVTEKKEVSAVIAFKNFRAIEVGV